LGQTNTIKEAVMRAGLFATAALAAVSIFGSAWAQTAPTAPAAPKFQAMSFGPSSETKVDFTATKHAPGAKGYCTIKTSGGPTSIEASFSKLPSPTTFGPCLTYVLWSVSPDGRAMNLGALTIKGDKASISATTRLSTFGLGVTAEPYYAVSIPSDVAVLAAIPPKNFKGKVQLVEKTYDMFLRASYKGLPAPTIDPKSKTAMEFHQLAYARQSAQIVHAASYAAEPWNKAMKLSEQASALAPSKKSSEVKQGVSLAREAIQAFEDARAMSVTRATAEQAAATQAALQGQTARAEEAEAVIREAAAKAKELRAEMLKQLSGVFPTVDTYRGLMVQLGGIYFETGKADLTPAAREKLSNLAGMLSAHPGLMLDIEGYTDNVGSPESNIKLSEARANSLRDVLKAQGFAADRMWAMGFGQEAPIASNSTADGRAKNRRAEIIVWGEALGTKLIEAAK
jgi:outer membrane protein OmpA-like peptidoglycan-associated protein